MEPTSVAAISTGGLATDDDVFVDLSADWPTTVVHVLDSARPATMEATLLSLEAALRGPVPSLDSALSWASDRPAPSPATSPTAVQVVRAAPPTRASASASVAARWISARVLGPMALLVAGLMAVMAWIG